jgi:hypothetical protein
MGIEYLAKLVLEPFGPEIALLFGNPLVQPEMGGNHKLWHGNGSSNLHDAKNRLPLGV